MIRFVIKFYIFSFIVHNYIKSFRIDLNMPDHQFTLTIYNCTKIMMETGKEVVTNNREIAKISVIVTVIQAHLTLDQDV